MKPWSYLYCDVLVSLMESPRTVWVTHPSFKNLSEDDEVQVSNYFQSVRSSEGGSVESVQRVMSHDNQQTSALLFEFSDAAVSAARVCSRSHKLADIFSAPEDYALPEQSLTVTIHNADLPLPSPASNGQMTVAPELGCTG
ncbi:hypothetical protein EB796_003813 [Bugula neritina]|uniref:Uncharacterized protein n=1 Tax=Bugula neritina TaxID=10212 RepID=A0A7J7KI19_BUGNE|nr:hypothetical protein EB796_003813 [Bugula neritina]